MAETTVHSTIYPPLLTLTSIRLLTLEAGEGDSVVRCSVTVQDLKDDPSYAALSYTWGNSQSIRYSASEPAKIIFCNDKPLLVTENLHNALLKLRGLYLNVGGKRLLLWVDAICINQKDLAELSAQVSIMGRIFARASAVVTWVGDEDRNSQIAFQVMQRLVPIVDLWKAAPTKGFNYTYNDRTLFQKAGVPIVTGEEWGALFSFFERHFFHRCWIVQEISLARGAVLMCGYLFEEWGRLIALSKFLIESTWIPQLEVVRRPPSVTKPGPTLAIPAIFNDIKCLCVGLEVDDTLKSKATQSQIQANKAYSFLETLLLKTRHFNATNPRDAVYSMLSMASYVCESKFPELSFVQPNYFLPTQDVFVQITRDILLNTKRIGILSIVDRDECHMSGLPSWVPDYSASSPTSVLDSLPDGDDKLYNSFEDNSRSFHLSISNNVLQLNGFILDTISEIEPPSPPHSRESWVRICLNIPKIYINGQDRVEVLWRTVIADQDGQKSPAPINLGFGFRQYLLLKAAKHLYEVADKMKDLRVEGQVLEVDHWSEYDELAKDEPDKKLRLIPTRKEIAQFTNSCTTAIREGNEAQIRHTEQKAHMFAAISSAVAGKRKLFRTASNLLGLGPGSMKAGDSVWFFPTSNTPFVLRHTQGSYHELVGEAYLHGYMHGEIKKQNLVLQQVFLC